MTLAIARAAASFFSSLIALARTSRAPRKTPCQHVVDLVGAVRSRCGHDRHVVADLLRAYLGAGVGHGEDHRLWRHRANGGREFVMVLDRHLGVDLDLPAQMHEEGAVRDT